MQCLGCALLSADFRTPFLRYLCDYQREVRLSKFLFKSSIICTGFVEKLDRPHLTKYERVSSQASLTQIGQPPHARKSPLFQCGKFAGQAGLAKLLAI